MRIHFNFTGRSRPSLRENQRPAPVFRSTPINAQWADYRATDFSIDYRFDSSQIPGVGDLGFFSIGLDATYVDEYDFKVFAFVPIYSAAGSRNVDTGLSPPLPRWKANGRISWIRGHHSVVVFAHYIHHVAQDGFFFDLGFSTDDIASRTTWDVSYMLTWDGLIGEGKSTQFSLGAINVFETVTSPMVAFGNAGTQLQSLQLTVEKLTGAQLQDLIKKLPDGMTYEMDLEKENT